MVKRGYTILTAFLFAIILLGFVSAIQTSITIKTMGDKKLSVVALKPGEVYSFIDSYHNVTPVDGVAKFTIDTGSSYNLNVWLKEYNGDVILNQKFEEEYSAGSPLTLEFYPEWMVKQKQLEAEINARGSNIIVTNLTDSNESVSNDSVVSASAAEENTSVDNLVDVNVQPSDENSSKMTGFAIFSGNNLTIIYIVVGLIAVLAIVLLIIKLMKRKGNKVYSYYEQGYKPEEKKSDIKVRKLSEVMVENKKGEALLEAERKLKEAQEEIQRVKENSDRETKLKQEIVEKERELLRLRSGRQ